MSNIMKISRHRLLTDGEGIRTLVGFHGCPLNCKHCLNQQCKKPDTTVYDYKPEELAHTLSKDRLYFQITGGGITFGGGEPLLNSTFIVETLEAMDFECNIAVETSLAVEWEAVEKLIDYVDYWIIDIKDMNSEIYYRYTGESCRKMNENLQKLAGFINQKRLRIRVPSIPGYNNEQDIMSSLKELERLCPDATIETFDYITEYS